MHADAVFLPLFFFSLLVRERHALSEGRENPTTRALEFMHLQYRPQFWYFEILLVFRKLFLVGFAVFIAPGSLMQLVWALNVAISVIAIEVQVRPFRRISDSHCSLISALATIFVLLMCLVLRTASVVEDLRQSDVQASLWSFLDFDLPMVSTILFGSSGGVFAAVFGFAVYNVAQARKYPQLVHRHSGMAASLQKLRTVRVGGKKRRERHHLFLSHVWRTGQDQARVIKQLLKEILPGVRVFLDVDDLSDVSRLEEEISASQHVLTFVSQGYFESKTAYVSFAAL